MEEVFEEVPEPVAQSDEERGYSEESVENTTTEAYRTDELIDNRSKRTNNANDGDIEENKQIHKKKLILVGLSAYRTMILTKMK